MKSEPKSPSIFGLFLLAMGFILAWFLVSHFFHSPKAPPESTSDLEDSLHERSQKKVSQKNPSPRLAPFAPSPQTLLPANPPPLKVVDAKEAMNSLSPSQQLKKLAQDRIVPFKNVKGMAVAYDDVLLGQVETKLPTGFTHLPKIEYWPTSTIPYSIQRGLPHPDRILSALKILSEQTSLVFVPVTPETQDAIVFEVGEENCLSYLGKVGGFQPIYLSADCEPHHIMHEVLHALGFIHEHSRPDRDDYIEIKWNAIPPPAQIQFSLMNDDEAAFDLKYPYDLQSIMHYPSQNLTPNSQAPSLLNRQGQVIPQNRNLSPLDREKIKDLYN